MVTHWEIVSAISPMFYQRRSMNVLNIWEVASCWAIGAIAGIIVYYRRNDGNYRI